MTKVVSFGGHTFDADEYVATLQDRTGLSLPRVSVNLVGRQNAWPVIAGLGRPGRTIPIGIAIEDVANVLALRDQLFQWLDPGSEVPERLVIAEDDDSRERYVMALVESLMTTDQPTHYNARAVVDGDVFWRGTTPASDTWSVTASGQTKTLTNAGTAQAYPILKIKPTSAKTGGYAYKVWAPVRWIISESATKYPFDLANNAWNTATLVSGGKMQADGDDLRVQVDGVEVGRWLDGINTTTTQVWVNLDFSPKQEFTLKTGILIGDTVTVLDVNEDIAGAPNAGILMIDSEAFTYTGKTASLKRFIGVSRAQRGTSAAGHSAGATVWWVQHDIWILYGNSSATAPTVDNNYKPAFELTSLNSSWVYATFGENDGLRTGQWVQNPNPASGPAGGGECYTGNRYTYTDPWEEIGLYTSEFAGATTRFYLQNPCGISAANFTNGEKYGLILSGWTAYIQSKANSTWVNEYTISAPVSEGVWESWSRNETLNANSTFVGLYLASSIALHVYNLEAADCTITVTNPPTCTLGSEQGNYSLAVTITNQTTGEAVTVTFTMELNQEIELDTDAGVVTYLKDGQVHMETLTMVSGPRLDWLPLAPGSNTLRFDDMGTNAVTVAISWEIRYY